MHHYIDIVVSLRVDIMIRQVECMAKVIMVQGTMSSVGKSLIVAGLLKVFKEDGYKVAPFKSQNMALNSYITDEGLEMGRAQVVQAECAGITPSVTMNPILLKPNSDTGSQVIVNGEHIANMSAKEYFNYKDKLRPVIMDAFNKLNKEYDIIVIEGAGSPAEINLKKNDIVNMGMADMVDCPVILAGDIDRGGVFAQVYGTLELLSSSERQRIKGIVINKFRGDKSILNNGITMLEAKCQKEVVGVLPYIDINIDDEDSVTDRFNISYKGLLDIVVIKSPKISNFTDFMAIEKYGVRYVKNKDDIGNPDLIILAGTKNTIADMKWLRESGIEATIHKLAEKGCFIMGICGGYQMLGEMIVDGDESIKGMCLLPVDTMFSDDKIKRQVVGEIKEGFLKGANYQGYEIHQGVTTVRAAHHNLGCFTNNILGTYIHGIFDEGSFGLEFIKYLCNKKGVEFSDKAISLRQYKQEQYKKLGQMIRDNMDMDKIYKILDKKEQTSIHSPTIEHILPMDIEKRSMEIIEAELLKEIPEEYKDVVKRVIHTSADFDYIDNMYFTNNAVNIAREAIKNGANIITDTNMARAGINRSSLASHGGQVLCFMADEDVINEAKTKGTTRATASMIKASRLEGDNIIAIGNAPTALIKLKELIDKGSIRPALIIAVPVGFVNVVAAKELIMQTDIPLIVAKGRKGGSNVAAAICNALIYGIS